MEERSVSIYISLNEGDLDQFREYLGSEFATAIFLPLDFSSIMRLIFTVPEVQYHLPHIDSSQDDNQLTKQIYEQSQSFLIDLWEQRGSVGKQDFPAEYFWHCLFVNIYRLIYYCQDFVSRHKTEQVVLVKRNKKEKIGELQVDLLNFTLLLKDCLERAGLSVKFVDCRTAEERSTIRPTQQIKAKLKRMLKKIDSILRWKVKAIGGKDYRNLLVSPAYDNLINFDFAHAYKGGGTPQSFVSHGWPHYHSIRALVRYGQQKKTILAWPLLPDTSKIFMLDVNGWTVDIYQYFSATVEQYFIDCAKTQSEVDVFWRNCPRREEIKNLIFSFSPVFLYAYYLIKKIKENSGRVIVWQHGGLNGYADHFYRYILDYKLADVFLAYGQSHVSALNSLVGENCDKNVIVGSNMIYTKKRSYLRHGRVRCQDGYYLLLAPQTNYYQSAIKWDAPKQYQNIKAILSQLTTGRFGRVAVNGVKNHTMYRLMAQCLDPLKIDYTEASIDEIIAQRPKFLILDGVATTLLEAVAKYDGLIFVLNCQETWKINQVALDLLKKRVFYADSASELERQMQEQLIDKPKAQPPLDQTFRNQYVNNFSYERYKQILLTN